MKKIYNPPIFDEFILYAFEDILLTSSGSGSGSGSDSGGGDIFEGEVDPSIPNEDGGDL